MLVDHGKVRGSRVVGVLLQRNEVLVVGRLRQRARERDSLLEGLGMLSIEQLCLELDGAVDERVAQAHAIGEHELERLSLFE